MNSFDGLFRALSHVPEGVDKQPACPFLTKRDGFYGVFRPATEIAEVARFLWFVKTIIAGKERLFW
jgi:hypothetical protein